MVLLVIVAGPLIVFLVAAVIVDRRSKRVRGRVGRVRIPGGGLSHRMDVVAGSNLSLFDAGPSMARYAKEPDDGTPRR